MGGVVRMRWGVEGAPGSGVARCRVRRLGEPVGLTVGLVDRGAEEANGVAGQGHRGVVRGVDQGEAPAVPGEDQRLAAMDVDTSAP